MTDPEIIDKFYMIERETRTVILPKHFAGRCLSDIPGINLLQITEFPIGPQLAFVRTTNLAKEATGG